MSHHVFGIRHHGPGCARSLLGAFEELQPDAVIIEGPPDAEPVLALAADQGIRPPVAMLVYPTDEPGRSAYFPMAEFSPEWQAIRFAVAREIPVYFMDLPMKHRIALEKQREQRIEEELERQKEISDEDLPCDDFQGRVERPRESPADQAAAPDQEAKQSTDWERLLREDPVGLLALAAGYDDRELWWEQQIEQRRDAVGMFQGIMEAMTELRSSLEASKPTDSHFSTQSEAQPDGRRYENLREAYMRQTIRKAIKAGAQNAAVVCGAWHAPALQKLGPAKPDAELLKKLPTCKTTATWIPWTFARLGYSSGYGAGVSCPGWYDHLWNDPHRPHVRWIVRAATLLRKEDLDASAANVIEAIRLAESLAALRDLPLPGLAEVNEAILTTLCNGSPLPMALIREKLEVGDRLGAVPDSTPTVPLQKDLETWQKRLRLKPTTEIKDHQFDLRKENDRARSRLLYRLILLDIDWGQPLDVRGTGTFKEGWRLQWDVDFAVAIIEANVWGDTVEAAAEAKARQHADKAASLDQLSELLDQTILAELPAALNHILDCFQQRVAVAADVQHLMAALVPLARSQRYQDVRQTPVERLAAVFDVLFERVLVDLPPSVASLNDEAATAMVKGMRGVQDSLTLLQAETQLADWTRTLQGLLERDEVHGLVRGTACRLLFDSGKLDEDELSRLASLSLSRQWPPQQVAAWLEGTLAGSGLALIHLHGLWQALDGWLSRLDEGGFQESLPLVRRSFSSFSGPERRAIGETVKNLDPTQRSTKKAADIDIDADRADRVLPVLRQILGLN